MVVPVENEVRTGQLGGVRPSDIMRSKDDLVSHLLISICLIETFSCPALASAFWWSFLR